MRVLSPRPLPAHFSWSWAYLNILLSVQLPPEQSVMVQGRKWYKSSVNTWLPVVVLPPPLPLLLQLSFLWSASGREPQEGDVCGFLRYLPGAGIFPWCLAYGLSHRAGAKPKRPSPWNGCQLPSRMPRLTNCSHRCGFTLQRKSRCWRTVLKLWPVSLGACVLPSRKALSPSPISGRRRGSHHLLHSSPSPGSQPCPGKSLLPLATASTPSSELHLPSLSSLGLQRDFLLKMKITKQHSADNLWHFSWWHCPLCWHTLKGKEVMPQSTLWLKSTSVCLYTPLQLEAHLYLLLRPLEFNSLMLGSA